MFAKKPTNKWRGADKKSVWGPRHWHFLHQVAACYVENYDAKHADEKKRTYDFFKYHYHGIMPCSVCRRAYTEYINMHEIKLHQALASGSVSLQAFVYDLHDHVNKKLGKTTSVSFQEVLKAYNCYD